MSNGSMTSMIDREREQRRLRRAVEEAPELVILRGRRRIGKSYLVSQTIVRERTVYVQADEQPEAAHLRLLGREAGGLAGGGELRFDDWDAAFTFFAQQARSGPVALVLDEFQWLWDAQPALDSIIQRPWVRWQRDGTPVTLVLSGSALTPMETLLARDRPLYGRATYRPLLLPFDHVYAAALSPEGATPEDHLRRYAVLGGTPQYQVWAGRLPMATVLRERILAPGEALYEEPLHLLREERTIRDPGGYFAVLHAIARGATRNAEIATKAGVTTAALAKMLDRLTELAYVEQRTPVQPTRADGRPRPRYVVADPYFRFWFRYVLPNRSRLESGRTDEVATDIEHRLDDLCGPVFEECCRAWAATRADADRFPASERIGAYWTRSHDLEVDVVGTDARRWTALGSAKWSTRVLPRVVEQLVAQREALGAPASDARLVLFARGFADATIVRAAEHDASLVTLDDLYADG